MKTNKRRWERKSSGTPAVVAPSNGHSIRERLLRGMRAQNYEINITPHKKLMGRIGESGHTFYEAVAEFIDNSIDARTPEQKSGRQQMVIHIVVNVRKKLFSITDNGRGMNEQDLANCARLGHSDKVAGELGYAGIGLKSGALTLADNFFVRTAQKGQPLGYEFTYEESEFMNNPRDWTIPARRFVKEPDDHGTTLIIKDVSRINLIHPKIQYLKNDIAKRYRSFIQKGGVHIIVNKQLVSVEQVKWMDGYPLDFRIRTKYGVIRGKIGLMMESSQKGYFGFDMFRNGRMITTNSKFAIGTHPTSARISGEIHLDFVKVSHEKNKFLSETLEYHVAEQACIKSEVFKSVIREARKKSEDGDNKKENTIIKSYIDENLPIISHAIKELDFNLPMIQGSSPSVSSSSRGELNDKDFELVDKKTVQRKPTEQEPAEAPADKDEHKPREKSEKHLDIIEINGQKFRVNVEFFNEEHMGRKKIRLGDGLLDIYINKLYAGFLLTRDKNAYCLETVQDAIIESMFADHQSFFNEINQKKEGLITAIYKYQEHFKNKDEHHPVELTAEELN